MSERDDRERDMSYALKEAEGDMTCEKELTERDREREMSYALKEAEGHDMRERDDRERERERDVICS
jgi:hypothetical protein